MTKNTASGTVRATSISIGLNANAPNIDKLNF